MWIDARVRKPEEGVRVLVCFESRSFYYNPCIARCFYITGGGDWWQYEPGFIPSIAPIYWMPLPRIDKIEVVMEAE
jgi:hypothetical protein